MPTGLPLLLAAYAAGLVSAPYFVPQALPAFAPWLLAMVWLPLRKNRLAAMLLPLLLFTLGFSLYHLRRTPHHSPQHISSFVSQELLTVEGAILSTSHRPWGNSFLDLQAERVVANGIAASVKGRIRLFITEGELSLGAGDRIRFMARLRHPRPFGIPGEFDYPLHLAARELFVMANIPRATDFVPLAGGAPINWSQILQQRRQKIANRIDQVVTPSVAPLVRALTIGDKSAIQPPSRQLLADAGVSHLFAISGLHLGLIALMLYAVARLLYSRSEALLLRGPPGRYLPALLLPFLFLYLLFTGAALPTQRAFLAALCTALLLLFGRGTPPLHLLASAAFFLLLIDPLYLFEPSFQLSFAGVAGILLLLPRLLPALPSARVLRWPLALACTTLAATLATAPIALSHFHLLAPAALLTNLVAVPTIGFAAVPLGLAGVLLLDIWPAAAHFLLGSCAFILEQTLNLLAWMITWPFLSSHRLYPSPLQMAGIATLCWGVLLPIAGKGRTWPRIALLLVALLAILVPNPTPSGLTVTALSVGQGDATLATLDGRHYLIDGGGLRSETFDVGERLLAPALGRLGVHTLEAVLLTHDHPDHRQGLLHILAHFPVRAFWSATPLEALDPTLQKLLSDKRIPFVLFPAGWTTIIDSADISLQAFVPNQDAGLNDRSVVLYARRQEQGVLLTGDLEKTGVTQLLRSPPNGPVTLLKLPHHGSRHSEPQHLLEYFAPTAVFTSSGFGNVHHLPHQETVRAVAKQGLPLFRTDLQGTIRFHTHGESLRAQRWRQGRFQAISRSP